MQVAVNFSINDRLIPKIREEAQKRDVSKSKIVDEILIKYFELNNYEPSVSTHGVLTE